MRTCVASAALLLIVGSTIALSQTGNLPAESSTRMELHGRTAAESGAVQKPAYDLDQFPSDLPIDQISKIAQSAVSEATGSDAKRKGRGNLQKDLTSGSFSSWRPRPTIGPDPDATRGH